jgi:hypothetical protein
MPEQMAAPGPAAGRVVSAALWMVGLAVLLFWLPVLGPMAAGFVGGTKAGGVVAALTASLLPALVAAGLVAVLAAESAPLVVGAVLAGRCQRSWFLTAIPARISR